MQFKIRLAAAAVAICALGLATALQASGHKLLIDSRIQQFKAEVTSDTTESFSGRVQSDRVACKVGRVINVTHNGVLIATTVTDAAGNFTVTGARPPKGDDVVATMPKKILKKSRKHRHRCARDVITRKAP